MFRHYYIKVFFIGSQEYNSIFGYGKEIRVLGPIRGIIGIISIKIIQL